MVSLAKNKIYFADNDLESLDISTLFEYIEITGENNGEYNEVKRKIIKYFLGSALTTFIQKSKIVENYNDLKKEMIKRYDMKKFFKPEDELSKLTDQKFDKFMKYITAFGSLNAQINPPLTSERQIELFIRGVSDIEIKKSIDEGAPKLLDEAIMIARTKANSKFKYDSLEFYNAGFTDKFIDKENRINNNVQDQQPQIQRQQQVIRPTRIPFPPSGKHPDYNVKQEQNNYANVKKHQYKNKPKGKPLKCYKCGKLGHFANQCKEEVNTITEQDVFTNTLTEPGAISGVEHQIKLTQKDASFQAYPVKFTNEQKDFLDEHIKELLKYKIIRESNSQVSSSVVLRPKPDGSMRMCINYTKLNNITVKDRYPIPDINEIWNQIKGSHVYSKLDMISGYYQIRIREGDKYLTAFSVPQGLFEFNVMPFGLCNAPAVFQRTIHKIFKEENRLTLQSFYDDILSHSKSVMDHTPHLEGIFKKMRDNKLLAKLSKCQFFQEEVKFLGHIIESNGVQIDYDRLDPLMKLLDPKNVKELQRLIGTLNFFRKFVDNFASKIKPIYQLLRQDTIFEWNDAYKSICINIIERLKNNKIILKPFKLETDASDIGVGATLCQDHGIISFYSRTIRDTEKNYSASEKECLSVVCALEEFHYIIGTQETLVVTDNSAVSFLRNDLGKIRNKRFINWNVKLASYNITFKYRSGKENTFADALSSCPVEEVMSVISMGESVKLDSILDLKIAEEQRKDKHLVPIFKYLD
ncbi:hypothetical protein ACTFIT_000004 [Dictyostelium discoideum]